MLLGRGLHELWPVGTGEADFAGLARAAVRTDVPTECPVKGGWKVMLLEINCLHGRGHAGNRRLVEQNRTYFQGVWNLAMR